jgi:hypothetical protein
MWSQLQETLQSWLEVCKRDNRKLLIDSECGNQGKFQTHSKSQKNSQAGSNIPSFDALTFYLSEPIISFFLRDGIYSLVTL